MASEKKSKSEIIKKIIGLVSTTPKSMYELSKELNSNWDTIKNNVELLKELGILEVAEQKVFLKKDSPISIHEDVVAGLPISDAIRKKIYTLAKKIFDIWLAMTGKEPNKTQLQKAMIEISERFPALNIPRGWYFYGKIVIVKADTQKFNKELTKYDLKSLPISIQELEKEIRKVVSELSKFSIQDLMDYQYQKYEKKDYLIKREIEKLFLSKKFDKEKFANLLYELIFNFKIIKDDELNHTMMSLVKEAVSILIQKTFHEDVDKNVNFKIQLMETFSTFWKLYATYGLLTSLEGELGYDARIIKSVFGDRINFYANDLTDSFLNLSTFEV